MIDTSFLDEMHKKSPNINAKLRLLKDFLVDSWTFRNLPIKGESIKETITSTSNDNIARRRRGPFEAAKFGRLIKLNSRRGDKKLFNEEEILKGSEEPSLSNTIIIEEAIGHNLVPITTKLESLSTTTLPCSMHDPTIHNSTINSCNNGAKDAPQNDLENYKSEESIGLFSISNNSSFIMYMDNPCSYESTIFSVNDYDFIENDSSSVIKII